MVSHYQVRDVFCFKPWLLLIFHIFWTKNTVWPASKQSPWQCRKEFVPVWTRSVPTVFVKKNEQKNNLNATVLSSGFVCMLIKTEPPQLGLRQTLRFARLGNTNWMGDAMGGSATAPRTHAANSDGCASASSGHDKELTGCVPASCAAMVSFKCSDCSQRYCKDQCASPSCIHTRWSRGRGRHMT